MATFAIIYATASKMHRRTIADDDGQISLGTMPDGITPAIVCAHPKLPSSFHPLDPGETALINPVPPNAVSASDYSAWCTAIQVATGVTPPIITCALVDANNTVQQIIYADPAIDRAPQGFAIVQCYAPQITVGCIYNPSTQLFTTPAGRLPANSPGNPTAIPKIVQPVVIPNTAAIAKAV